MSQSMLRQAQAEHEVDDPMTEEQRIRALVHDLWSTLEGRALLDALFGETTDEDLQEVVDAYARRLLPPQEPSEAATTAAELEIRKRFPNAPADVADWDRWPAAGSADQVGGAR